ncbi:MAG: hypothetical protein GC182_21315 [Rhodopseudomonas sp.]|nr:hypothetical protein [Rhodopseudomonas sp.]
MTVAAPRQTPDDAPGRVCPIDYAYAPGVLNRAPDFAADTLYVVGGLYGNDAALRAIEAMAAHEQTPPQIVFNGDFHWFDAQADWFAAIERGVAPYRTLRGNVETEVARPGDIGAGCGCAYPPSVSGDVVTRSNEIIDHLRTVTPPSTRARLAQLPMHLVARIGALTIGIVHGDAAALAGWRFAHDELDHPRRRDWLAAIAAASHVDVFASTHTCLAALRDFDLPAGRLTVVNNGAAGMPNFAGDRRGVITRIATTPSPHRPLYGLRRDGLHIDALAVDYNADDFLRRFLTRWPPGSPAYESYYRRIVDGPDYAIAQARPRP